MVNAPTVSRFGVSHAVAAAGSPRRKPWDMFASKPLAPDGAAARFAPFFCTQNLSPPPGLGIINDSYPHGLRHGLPAVTPNGVKVSAIRLAQKLLDVRSPSWRYPKLQAA